MLKFNPDERITVLQALAHPYLSQLHNPVRRHSMDGRTRFNVRWLAN